MPGVYSLADEYVTRSAALDPTGATFRGIPGHDADMTDFSPDGVGARADHERTTLTALAALRPDGIRERIAADVMRERLEVTHELHEAREWLREVRVLGSPIQTVRQCFDLMATETRDDWEVIAARMERVPQGLSSVRATLGVGLQEGVVAARRQALGCAEQATVWGGGRTGTPPFFSSLVEKYHRAGISDGTLGRRLEEAARRATEAYAEIARFLTDEYAPRAAERDAVGQERYALWARAFTGMELDLIETYHWGWDELRRIGDQMTQVAARILPGAQVPAVVELLEADPRRSIQGVETFRRWLQDLMDRTVAELDGVHFDIPEPVKRVEAMIAPPGGTAAMYYTRPSEDFRRPGRTWYPTLGKTRFPLWREVSTAYHEGVPGHHLQLAHIMYLAGELSRYQRTSAFVPGFSEGWALYAERLMGELGYLDKPDYELGMLRAQAFRAMRIIVDIGLHLELKIPASASYHPSETWTPAIALPFAITHGHGRDDFMKSEVDRYLGRPGQAICYKVGEREWLAVREEARRRGGAAFDRKAFHARALNLGPMGLAQLRREFAAAQLSGRTP